MAFTRHRVHNTLDPVRVKADGTKGASADPTEERLRARVQQNTAYEKYKASLHAFFDGNKPLPENLRAMLATRPGADEHLGVSDEERAEAEAAAAAAAESDAGAKKTKKKAKKGPAQKERGDETRRARRLAPTGGEDYKGLVAAIRKATSPREVEGAIDALKGAGYPLPPTDGELLSKALGHKDEAIICEALRGLLDIAAAGGIKSPRLLRTRIDNVALLASSSECRELCAELKAKLA